MRKGETQVFIVNHHSDEDFARDTVEKFTYDPQRNRLHHVQTYSSELFRV